MEEKNNKKKKENKNLSKNKSTEKVNSKSETKIRKEEKNKKQETKKSKTVTQKENVSIVAGNEMANLIKIVLIVTAVFLIFYGITTIVTKNNDENNSGTDQVTIQYDEILLGTLFEQPNSEYYVLVTKEDDHYTSTYSSIISSYKAKENSIRVYNANLDNGFNKSYKAEESNISNNLNELKLASSTLLKIKDKKIVGVYEGNTAIIGHLNSLLK